MGVYRFCGCAQKDGGVLNDNRVVLGMRCAHDGRLQSDPIFRLEFYVLYYLIMSERV